MDYARALATAGRFGDARRRLQAVDIFVNSLPESDRILVAETAAWVDAQAQRVGAEFTPASAEIVRINRQVFDERRPLRSPMAFRILEEIAWFENSDRSALGVLLRDRGDDDYGWVSLREQDGQFSTDRMNASYESPHAAVLDLWKAMLSPPTMVAAGSPGRMPREPLDPTREAAREAERKEAYNLRLKVERARREERTRGKKERGKHE